jgi:hypothetical protein
MKVDPAIPARKHKAMSRSTPIFLCAVAVALVPAATYIWHLSRNGSHGLPSYIAWGVTCGALGVGAAAWAIWAVRTRLLRPLGRPLAALGIMVVTVALTSAPMYALGLHRLRGPVRTLLRRYGSMPCGDRLRQLMCPHHTQSE